MFKVLKDIKWYEYLFICAFIVAYITVGIIFKSNAMIIINAIASSIGVCLIAKGSILGQFCCLIQVLLYSIISFQNQYYGEIITSLGVSLPVYIIAIVTWFRNLGNGGIVKVTRKISWKEFLIVGIAAIGVFFALYYILKALDTAQLLLSTFSSIFSVLAGYFMIRRCEYSFVFYLVNNIICGALWIINVFVLGNYNQLVTFLNFVLFFISNFYGFINWIILKKKQQKGLKEEKDGTVSASR